MTRSRSSKSGRADRHAGQMNLLLVYPACLIHSWVLQTPPVRIHLTERVTMVRRWRCSVCKRWTEAPVSRQHELYWQKKIRPGAMPDQTTIYDALGLTTETGGTDVILERSDQRTDGTQTEETADTGSDADAAKTAIRDPADQFVGVTG